MYLHVAGPASSIIKNWLQPTRSWGRQRQQKIRMEQSLLSSAPADLTQISFISQTSSTWHKTEASLTVSSLNSSFTMKTAHSVSLDCHSLTGGDWIHSTHNVSVGFFTSDGTITSPMIKFYIKPVSLWPHLSYADEGLDSSVTLSDLLMMSQQNR